MFAELCDLFGTLTPDDQYVDADGNLGDVYVIEGLENCPVRGFAFTLCAGAVRVFDTEWQLSTFLESMMVADRPVPEDLTL